MELNKIEKQHKLKIMFMGTSNFAVPILEGLIKNYGVRVVVSQPNRNKKDGVLIDTPVKKCADEHTVLVLQPENIDEAVVELLSLEPDLIITCAYGQKLPKTILDYPRLGCYNVHASLLPKLRGGAPIQRALIKGFTETGITIIKMAEALDAGDIIIKKIIPIFDEDNATTLANKLSVLGRDLLLEIMPNILEGKVNLEAQNKDEATFAFTIKKNDEKIDFAKSSKQIFNLVRGLAEIPGAYCLVDNKRLKVFKSRISDNFFEHAVPGEITAIYEDGFGVKAGNREIIFLEVQPEGGNKMSAVDYIRGLANREKVIGKILR